MILETLDSLYTERYMHTPQHNPSGYAAASISNVSALAETTRFLIFHGVSDDNVHMQNSLVLIDKLDLSNVLNYDVQVFPDSDHGIFFHNGHKVVYEREFPQVSTNLFPSIIVNLGNVIRPINLAHKRFQRRVGTNSRPGPRRNHVSEIQTIHCVVIRLEISCFPHMMELYVV